MQSGTTLTNNISEQLAQVLGPKWAACSLRAAQAVWQDYPVL